jgi:hypothetical protein
MRSYMNIRLLAIDQLLSDLPMRMANPPEFRYGRWIAEKTIVIRWNTTAPAADSSWMIRYRFESRAALDRHLRYGSGGFFVPVPELPGPFGSRVVVELGFPDDGDPALLHGLLRSRSFEGIRLAMPSIRAASRWTPGPDSPRRQHRRVACDLFVEVHPPHASPWLCRALDLSDGGVRLATGSFETGVAGDEVSLALLAPDGDLAPIELRTRLCWAGSREAGFALAAPPSELGSVLEALDARWVSVHELAHSAQCPCAAVAEVRVG